MSRRLRLELSDEQLGRARDLSRADAVPLEDRNSVISLAVDAGLDAVEALYCEGVTGHVCVVSGCTNASIQGALQCADCLAFDPGGER